MLQWYKFFSFATREPGYDIVVVESSVRPTLIIVHIDVHVDRRRTLRVVRVTCVFKNVIASCEHRTMRSGRQVVAWREDKTSDMYPTRGHSRRGRSYSTDKHNHSCITRQFTSLCNCTSHLTRIYTSIPPAGMTHQRGT